MQQKPTNPEMDVADDFAEFLREFAHGTINEQLSRQLRDVIAACKKSGSKGSVTLKLSCAAKGDLASLVFSIKASKPEPELPGQTLFATDEGSLSTSNPAQLKLPAKVLDAPQGIRTVVPFNGGDSQ